MGSSTEHFFDFQRRPSLFGGVRRDGMDGGFTRSITFGAGFSLLVDVNTCLVLADLPIVWVSEARQLLALSSWIYINSFIVTGFTM